MVWSVFEGIEGILNRAREERGSKDQKIKIAGRLLAWTAHALQLPNQTLKVLRRRAVQRNALS
jgi:hypothetical protein